MATGKDTGDGLVTVDYGTKDPVNPYPIKSILFHNFNFDGDELKPQHEAELDRRVVSQIIKDRRVVRITGHASKQGDAGYNLDLSRRRALAVRNYLIQQGVPEQFVPLDELRARGEADSTSPFDDDELDRGVSVEFLPNNKPRPRPPAPKRVDPPPPEPLVKPPSPDPIPVPENISRLVVLREVFINHTLIEHDPGAPGKGDRTVDGWRSIGSLTVIGQAPVPFERELDHVKEDSQFFINPIQALSAERDQYDMVAYFYKYDPESTPGQAPSLQLPKDSRGCVALYNSGTPVNRLPRVRLG